MKIFLLMLGILLSSFTYAEMTIEQNPCMYNPAYCGGGGQASTKVINIPSRYGAIALDKEKMILGSSENNLKSMRSAKKEAVQDCINLGGSKSSCKVLGATRNGCISLAFSKKGTGSVAFNSFGETSQEAENIAIEGCKNAGGEKCSIAYSQCSRDPRYQVGR